MTSSHPPRFWLLIYCIWYHKSGLPWHSSDSKSVNSNKLIFDILQYYHFCFCGLICVLISSITATYVQILASSIENWVADWNLVLYLVIKKVYIYIYILYLREKKISFTISDFIFVTRNLEACIEKKWFSYFWSVG